MVIFILSIYLDNERLSKSGTHSLHFVSMKHATVLLGVLGMCEQMQEGMVGFSTYEAVSLFLQ